jgi:hypothetical protein
MKLKTILGLLLLLSLSSVYAQKPNIEDSVEELRQLMIEPTKEGLMGIAHFKLSYGHSNGKLENRDEFVEALVSKKSDFREIKLTNQTIEIIGKTAVVRHDLAAKTMDGGKAGEVKLHVLTVWLKQKKGWVIFARQAVK